MQQEHQNNTCRFHIAMLHAENTRIQHMPISDLDFTLSVTDIQKFKHICEFSSQLIIIFVFALKYFTNSIHICICLQIVFRIIFILIFCLEQITFATLEK